MPVPPDALHQAVWIDLVAPTDQERQAVAGAIGRAVPTEAELSEIETSSRLNFVDDVFVLSMPLIARDTDRIRGVPGGFVLSQDRLVTVRFAPHLIFDRYADRETTNAVHGRSSVYLFAGLMEALIDRAADGLEQVRSEMEAVSGRIFRKDATWANKHEDAILRDTLATLGRIGETISLIRESQVAADRIIPYVERSSVAWVPPEVRERLRIMHMDVHSLTDFDTHLNDKLQFLLDATLGFINIAQNNVMKVMTIASVVGVPPVLVAGIYGMNFKNMPELDWVWGYPYGLALIVITAFIPLAWFKWRNWI
ncbi:MAG: magnesium transporter CorA family protein [Acetobacteraceae bacterium]|nr:magnesium transporter CorA family protein [Acetobacteraceae bacterium]